MDKKISDKDNWIQTYTGKAFNFINPQKELVDIQDISVGLNNIYRYTGQTDYKYTVAMHSIIVSTLVPLEFAIYGLLHDATEAYLGDMHSPLKKYLPKYRKIEKNLHKVIMDKFNLQREVPQIVKDVDLKLLYTEKRDLFKDKLNWGNEVEPYKFNIFDMIEITKRINFLDRFNLLYEEIKTH